MCREVRNDFRDWCNLERSTDNDDEVNEILVVVCKTIGKCVREWFTEECNVWLHDPYSREVVIVFIFIVGVGVEATLFLILTIVGALSFHSCGGAESALAGGAAVTGRDSVGTDVGEDGFARDLVLAFYARGS
jgi:hypothetical protein